MGRIGQEAISVMKVMHPSVLQVSEGNFLEVVNRLLKALKGLDMVTWKFEFLPLF